MTVDLLRKSGLAVLASRRCVLLGEGRARLVVRVASSSARLCRAMGGSVSIPSCTRGLCLTGTGVDGSMGRTDVAFVARISFFVHEHMLNHDGA